MTVEAHAKINWTLRVLGVRDDGYHDLQSIVLPVSLHDTVSLLEADGITCRMDSGDLPQESNLAYRAAVELRRRTGYRGGVEISIAKRIPAGAGLGGGSADAAAVLNGLNELWGLCLPKAELCEIAADIGSDVPALVLGGAVLMEGRGERVLPYVPEDNEPALPNVENIVLYVPQIFASTPAVYHEFRESDRGLCRNDLQPAALRLYPGIADAIRKLEADGLSCVTMSGSGSAVYGVDCRSGWLREQRKI